MQVRVLRVFLLVLFLVSNPTVFCETADVRVRISECFEKLPEAFKASAATEKERLLTLYQHTVATVRKTPDYVTISDGTLVLDAESNVNSGLVACKTTPPAQKRPFFSRAEIKKTSIVPSLTGSGLQLKKKKFTPNSIYFQSGKHQPKYVRASGKTKVFGFGCPLTKTMEIWASDNADYYIEEINVKELIIHARSHAKVFIKSGKAKKIYVSSREHTSIDIGGVAATEVIINATNGNVGTLKINATQKLVRLGTIKGNVETVDGSQTLNQAISRNALVYKTKRLFARSIPNFFKRTARCAFLTSKYALISTVTLGVVVSSAIGVGLCVFADQILNKLNDLLAPSGEKITYGTLFDLATGKTTINELGDTMKDGLIDHYSEEYIRSHLPPDIAEQVLNGTFDYDATVNSAMSTYINDNLPPAIADSVLNGTFNYDDLVNNAVEDYVTSRFSPEVAAAILDGSFSGVPPR